MQISIAGRLRPYSHTPGTHCVLPGSLISLQVFPALIRFEELSSSPSLPKSEISIGINGPMKEFTVRQDLEQGFVLVWGKTPDGFIRYRITAEKGGMAINFEKTPKDGLSVTCSNSELAKLFRKDEEKLSTLSKAVAEKDTLLITTNTDVSNREVLTGCCKERLSLGSHKAQDWDMIVRRQDLREIFPAWLRLGQMSPSLGNGTSLQGAAALFKTCADVSEERKTEILHDAFLNLFKVGFEGMFSPRLEDKFHQGFSLPEIEGVSEPFFLLQEGAKAIKSLFVKTEGAIIDVLPALPPQFFCGRYLNIDCDGLATLDLEWSKKRVRKMSFTAEKDGEIQFKFHRHLKTFRLRKGRKDRGRVMKCGDLMTCVAGKQYMLDNFEK
ncbi:MAG: hypothetical protein ACI9S8_001026 [Chlamydiales bacterium]|jgi:hypothetical protein